MSDQDTQDTQDFTEDTMYKYASRTAMGQIGFDFTYCIEENRFYIYQNNLWRNVHELELLNLITVKYPNIVSHSISRRKQIIENLKHLTARRLSEFNQPPGWINLINGMLYPQDGAFADHEKESYSTIRLNYEYNIRNKCELWVKTLGEIFEGHQDKINLLQEFFGYCLTPDTRKEKALLLLGESRTGKSTILHVLRHLLGVHNCSSVPLKFINNPQYTPMLINKLINIDSDVSGKAQEFEAEFKIITSGEPVSCNQKFIATFEFTPHCKLVMAANEFPRITDHSSAFYKRLILIPCDKVFEDDEQNIHLKDNLISELPGILNWAIDGLERLNKRGRFEHNKFMVDAIEELREASNPVEAFFKDSITPDNSAHYEILKSDLYEKYVKWCKENGNLPLSSIKFSQAVYQKFSKFTPKLSKSSLNNRPYVWKNLRYINQHPPGELIQWEDPVNLSIKLPD